MTPEEAKERYKSIDFKVLNAKITDSMMEIVRLPNPDEAHTLFHKVLERFTVDELAFIACMDIAEKFKDFLMKMNKELVKGAPGTPVNFDEFINNLKKSS